MTDYDMGNAVYTPAQSSKYAIDAIQRIRDNKQRGANLGLQDIDDYFAPVMPGQVTAVIGQTSHYKSGFLHAWERALANQLIKDGREEEAIIHISVEECVEEQIYLQLAHETGDSAGKLSRGEYQDWDMLKAAAIKIASIPIYRVGDSLARPDDMPNLYLSNMIKAINKMVKGEICEPIKPAALFFDYLQAFPFDPEVKRSGGKIDQRRLQVREDIYRLRHAAALFDCPVIVAVQAKQHLDGAKGEFQMPGIYDGEESSSIAQRCDRVITLWMPARTYMENARIEYNNLRFTVKKDLLFIRIAKQRGGLPAGKIFACNIDFDRNIITNNAEVVRRY